MHEGLEINQAAHVIPISTRPAPASVHVCSEPGSPKSGSGGVVLLASAARVHFMWL